MKSKTELVSPKPQAPMDGSYGIVAAGGSSGAYRGVIVTSTVRLAARQQVRVAVGGIGGGATFVYTDCSTPLLVAAGGGASADATASNLACGGSSIWVTLCPAGFRIAGGVFGGQGGSYNGCGGSYDAGNPPSANGTFSGYNSIGASGYVRITLLFAPPPPPAIPVAALVFDGSSSARASFGYSDAGVSIASYVRHADSQSTYPSPDAGTLWELRAAADACDGTPPLFALGVNPDRTAWLSCRTSPSSAAYANSSGFRATLGANLFDGAFGVDGAVGWVQPVVSVGPDSCPGPCPYLRADLFANGGTVAAASVTQCSPLTQGPMTIYFGAGMCAAAGFVGSMVDLQMYNVTLTGGQV